jgi:AcrR family transcriptional regulator
MSEESVIMARKPRSTRNARPLAGGAASVSEPSEKSARERIIQSFMELLAEKPIEEIGLTEIAQRAHTSLAELRGMFTSKLAMLAGHVKEIDRQTLAGEDADITEELPRERLFDVLMRRLELLETRRAAVRSLLRSCRRNPGLAFTLNGLAVRSQQWMLEAAGIDAAGPRGAVRAQGLALLFASVLRTWVDDEDPGHARTMAALDRALARGQRLSGLLDELCRIRQFVRRSRRRRPWSESGPNEETAAV